LTTQLSPAGVKPRSSWIAGIATVTIEPSSTIISMLVAITPRADSLAREVS